ncbi:MAG TPA: DNA repair protein RecN [Terriglobales bacterium]|nr:DNA repair protein RecN [Terriglobales bacterium]
MLRELRLENYAVIDNVVVEFAPGLNLLTGETGAGKSILIDALALLLGEKASTDVIRHHSERAVVAAVFEAEGKAGKALSQILEANGLDRAEGELILRREIAAAGKGRVFINNQPATVAVLRQLASHLAAIHAQSESLVSFDAAARLELLDAFAGAQIEPVQTAFHEWKAVRERIAELERDEQDRLRLLDLWSFQQKEIEAARPQAGEDDRLESEKRVLANAEKIYAAAMGAYDVLYESNASASSALRAGQRQIEELARFDPRFKELSAALDSARITVEDAGATLRDYAGGVQASPERLTEVEDRLAALDRLKRKYGPTLAEVIAFAEELARKLAEMQNKDEVLGRLRKELAAAGQQYLAAARALSRKRQEAARKLEKLVEHEVNELAMKVRFRIQVAGSAEEAGWTAAGFDEVSYLIATNPGEREKPLEQIASGGELSRVMLALKACVEAGQGPQNRRNGVVGQRTLVFDEIDTGIGGRAAEAVGRKLKQLAGSSQVLCVTHLPQIACFADHHYLIQKSIAGGRTRTTVRRIQGSERTDEVARMLSGARLTEASRRNAEQMLRAHA